MHADNGGDTTEETFDVVVLSFEPREQSPQTRLQSAFGIDAEVSERLVGALPVAVQRGVARVRAEYFRRALFLIGATAEVRDQHGQAVPASEPAPVPAAIDPTSATLSVHDLLPALTLTTGSENVASLEPQERKVANATVLEAPIGAQPQRFAPIAAQQKPLAIPQASGPPSGPLGRAASGVWDPPPPAAGAWQPPPEPVAPGPAWQPSPPVSVAPAPAWQPPSDPLAAILASTPPPAAAPWQPPAPRLEAAAGLLDRGAGQYDLGRSVAANALWRAPAGGAPLPPLSPIRPMTLDGAAAAADPLTLDHQAGLAAERVLPPWEVPPQSSMAELPESALPSRRAQQRRASSGAAPARSASDAPPAAQKKKRPKSALPGHEFEPGSRARPSARPPVRTARVQEPTPAWLKAIPEAVRPASLQQAFSWLFATAACTLAAAVFIWLLT